ncbi:MAG TPA: hypothetical protein VHV30_10575 [Polyangiaceae bacterium]|jgi:hypothetical protein|nr:hypothetical protein [Polyangiaceae bacterium]
MAAQVSNDPHAQLRALYQVLLSSQDCFDEFKRMLALYEFDAQRVEAEPAEAAATRQKLNARIRSWVGERFTGLSATQMLQWRAIVVEERFNVSLSPWKESNQY